jgi:cytochrome c-type biogenesis protein CcmH/NrfF
MIRLVLTVIALLAVPGTALAQECPQTTLGDIENEVMCPVCGTPLALATEAPQAQREREYIQRLIDDCRSKDEIKQALVAEFGDDVLALPGDEGDGDVGDVLVYAVPTLGLVLAGGAIAFALMRWRSGGGGPRGRGGRPGRGAPAAAGGDDPRLDADMERYDL